MLHFQVSNLFLTDSLTESHCRGTIFSKASFIEHSKSLTKTTKMRYHRSPSKGPERHQYQGEPRDQDCQHKNIARNCSMTLSMIQNDPTSIFIALPYPFTIYILMMLSSDTVVWKPGSSGSGVRLAFLKIILYCLLCVWVTDNGRMRSVTEIPLSTLPICQVKVSSTRNTFWLWSELLLQH